MVLLQLKDPVKLLVNRQFLPCPGFLSIESDVKFQPFLFPSFGTSFA